MLDQITKKITLSVFSIIVAIPASSAAAELMVPLPYTTIQSAINAAGIRDIIKIAPGTYSENISLGGKNVTIEAFNTNFDTIIDGGAKGPVVTFQGSETSECVLRNLILRNGKAAQGAGVTGNFTMATIKNCTIGGNIASGSGGGVHGLSGLMQNCVITLNQAVDGGGIAGCDGLIDKCKITLNKASGAGGGIFDTKGVIKRSEISKNEAVTAGGGLHQIDAVVSENVIKANVVTATGPTDTPASSGGGINDCSGTMTLNMIFENTSNGDGGGISNSDALIQNNIITNNSARRGGGMVGCKGRVENNTIWGNGGVTLGGGCLNMGTLVANCIIYGNSAPAGAQWSGDNSPTYSCVQGWTGGQTDIITEYPQFEDATAKRFKLLASSPCVDAGKFIPGLFVDYDGDARPYDGSAVTRGDGSNFDIGADEFVPANIDLATQWGIVKTKYKKAFPKLKTQIVGNAVVANVGSEATASPFSIQFYLSVDSIFDAGDLAVGKTINVKKLKAGKAKKAKVQVKLPLNQVATGLFLIAVADIGNTVAEGNELNNIAAYGPLP